MYLNLKGEMARKGITGLRLAELTKIPYSTLQPKIRGDKPIKLDEAKNIKAAIGSEMTIEELFDENCNVGAV